MANKTRFVSVQGVGERCYKGSPESVDVQPAPQKAPEEQEEPQPVYQYSDPGSDADGWEIFRLAPLLWNWFNFNPAGG